MSTQRSLKLLKSPDASQGLTKLGCLDTSGPSKSASIGAIRWLKPYTKADTNNKLPQTSQKMTLKRLWEG